MVRTYVFSRSIYDKDFFFTQGLASFEFQHFSRSSRTYTSPENRTTGVSKSHNSVFLVGSRDFRMVYFMVYALPSKKTMTVAIAPLRTEIEAMFL